ncbi:hypothetical protein CK498_10125 [Halomonas salipaludis]|uniref:Uncharacterized protein n=1 Tax=Halomonas salipaludis TaxID=2032625 RepID=A0A2A2EYY4_9GAMM|nr:hypothetical protein CK498_10125 [Halomonas salipaludis]
MFCLRQLIQAAGLTRKLGPPLQVSSAALAWNGKEVTDTGRTIAMYQPLQTCRLLQVDQRITVITQYTLHGDSP